MSEEAIYWIFSTLPQVLAALTGLVMAGLSFFDQNLKKEVANDSTKEVILQPILNKTYRWASIFLIVSIIAIVVDVVVLSYAKELSDDLQSISYLSIIESLWIMLLLIVLILFNGGSLLLIFPILNPVLDPDSRNKIRDKQLGKVREDLNLKDDDSASDEDDSENKQSENDSPDTPAEEPMSVTPIVFMEYFREFEKAVRRFFPKSSGISRNEGLTSLVKKLSFDEIISKKSVFEITNIIKLRNLYIHGAEIGDVSINVIKELEKLTASLSKKFENHIEALPASEMEDRFIHWINNNVEDLDEAFNLEQAIKGECRYGEYDVIPNGYGLTIRSDRGNTLFLSDNDMEEFLKLLEKQFAKPGNTLEDQKSFEDAVRRIQEEDNDDD